jgi:flagellar hook-associated protein 3 FlgL
MRIPDSKFFNIFLRYDRERVETLARKTEELSSGKSLLFPSDAPVESARVLRFKKLVSSFERFNRNIDVAKTNLENAESSLASAIDSAQTARVKIVELLNTGTMTEDDAKVMVDYLQQVKSYIIGMANTKIGDSYIFGGVKTNFKPFTEDGVYQGEENVTTVPVANGVEVPINFNGGKIFGVKKVFSGFAEVDESGNINPDAGWDDSGNYEDVSMIISAIDKVIDAIENGNYEKLNSLRVLVFVDEDDDGVIDAGGSWEDTDGDGIKDTYKDGSGNVEVKAYSILDAFDFGLKSLMEQRSIIGSQIETVENLKVQNENLRLHYSQLISELEDADYAQAIAEFQQAKTAYEALLSAIQQTKDLSLLRFYR